MHVYSCHGYICNVFHLFSGHNHQSDKFWNNSDPRLAFAIKSLTLQSLGNVKLCALNFLIFFPKSALLPDWSPRQLFLQFFLWPRAGGSAEGFLNVGMDWNSSFPKSEWECRLDKVFSFPFFSSMLHRAERIIHTIREIRTCTGTSGWCEDYRMHSS